MKCVMVYARSAVEQIKHALPVAKNINITPRRMLHPITADKQTLQYMSLIMIHHQLDPARQASPVKDLQLDPVMSSQSETQRREGKVFL